MKKSTFIKPLLSGLFLAWASVSMYSQVTIQAGNTVTEDFSSMGTNDTATLPTGWRADKSTSVRAVGTYSAAATATDRLGGNNMATTAANGIYNYVVGDHHAIGGLSSGSASKSVNVYLQLQNNGAADIDAFQISYDVEKYRNGSNAVGFSMQLYYSTNGSSWTSAGSNFLTSFTKDADNSGITPAPGEVKSVTNKELTVSLPAGSSLYLAWNYSVASGSTTSNAQALGITNVSVKAIGDVSEPVIAVKNAPGIFNSSVGSPLALNLEIEGANLTDNIILSGLDGTDFQVNPSSLPTTGGIIELEFDPVTLGVHTAQLILSSGTVTEILNLEGYAGLSTPTTQVVEDSEITSDGFTARWNSCYGADEYIMDVYRKETGDGFGEELVVNGDFETGDISPWVSSSSSQNVLTVVVGQGVNGSPYYVTYLPTGTSTQRLEQTVTVESGKTYVFSFWYNNYTKSGNGIKNYTIQGTSGTNYIEGGQDTPPEALESATEWTKYEKEFTAAESAVRISIRAYTACDIDMVSLKEVGQSKEKVPVAGSPFATTDLFQQVTGLEKGTTYYFTVTAKATVDNRNTGLRATEIFTSEPSAEISVTTSDVTTLIEQIQENNMVYI
ncbi:MAG: carbohydrate binding domain-containing protein, partial [Candidatus Azobacteroides sp.]|nr:carbohydrate binding domain-containing protein [Candidatus Azobacteroides sp.]